MPVPNIDAVCFPRIFAIVLLTSVRADAAVAKISAFGFGHEMVFTAVFNARHCTAVLRCPVDVICGWPPVVVKENRLAHAYTVVLQ